MASNRLSTEMEETMKKGFLLAVLCVVLGVTTAHTEEIKDQKEWVWGCTIKGRTLDGGCALRRFTEVGDADPDTDTGAFRLLGFEPGNVVISKIDGQPIWMRINQDLFLKPGETRLYSAAKCTCAR